MNFETHTTDLMIMNARFFVSLIFLKRVHHNVSYLVFAGIEIDFWNKTDTAENIFKILDKRYFHSYNKDDEATG